jgi:pilus assembly protein CpaF
MKMIALANLGGGDTSQFVSEFIKSLPKNCRALIVEMPCLGMPRLGYSLLQDEAMNLPKEKTIDQLLLNYDRKEQKLVEEYIWKQQQVDLLLIDPKSLPETPVIGKLGSNQCLIELPLYLKKQATDYDYVMVVTQGRLIHPTTHFSLRVADAVVLYNADPVDFAQNYAHYTKLKEIFGVESERMFMFSKNSGIKLDSLKLHHKYTDLFMVWEKLTSIDQSVLQSSTGRSFQHETVGIIEPLEYLDYEVELSNQTMFSESDTKKLNDLSKYVRNQLQQQYMDDYVRSLTNEQARQKVKYLIGDIVREQSEYAFNTMKINDVIVWVQKEITELGVIQEILDDPTISSIEINGPDAVIVEIDGKDIHRPDIRFNSVRHYHQVISKILTPIGKSISSMNPIVDANYRGFRICVVADNEEYQGVSAKYPLVSIRKFPPDVYSDEDCIRYGNATQEIIDFLKFIVPVNANIIVSGGTNSGKTAQLIRLPMRVDPITRIISIEDSQEMMLAEKIQYQHYKNLPSLLVKELEDFMKSYNIDKLVKASLRLKPTILCIGEIRDEAAAKQSLNGMNTGHTVWSTIHANSAREAAIRLVQLNGNTSAAASQVATSIDIIIFQKKLKNGVRKITEIAELLRYEGTEEPILNTIFKYQSRTKRQVQVGKIISKTLLEKIYLAEPDDEDILRWCKVSQEELIAL